METDKIPKPYKLLEDLARICNYQGLTYEIAEIKDGRIFKIKNIRIEEIELTKE